MAVHDFRSQRLFVDDDLSAGNSIEASREQANYLLNVLRLNSGSELLVFNGRDGEWRVEIEAMGRKKCNLVPIQQTRSQPDRPSLRYCFAPLKQGRLDYMVQKAVEMGVGVLQPVLTQYTQVRSLNEKRFRANAIEAVEQCGILSLPEICPAISFDQFVSTLSPSDTVIFCDEARPHAQDLDQVVSTNMLTLMIGPEGGFSDDERNTLQSLPQTVHLGLGPRILRADTAAVAALAVLQSKLGDWYS